MQVDLVCKRHPGYKAVRPPRKCVACGIIYDLKQNGLSEHHSFSAQLVQLADKAYDYRSRNDGGNSIPKS